MPGRNGRSVDSVNSECTHGECFIRLVRTSFEWQAYLD